jgi:hypothetical protein
MRMGYEVTVYGFQCGGRIKKARHRELNQRVDLEP